MINKKGLASIVLMISVLAGLITVLGAIGILDVGAITGTGSYIQRPIFYYDKCEAVGSYSYSADISIAKTGGWLAKPSVSDGYDVQITADNFFDIGQKRVEYYVCNSRVLRDDNCRLGSPDGSGGVIAVMSSSGVININNIRNNEYVWAQYQDGLFYWKASDGASYQVGFQPFGIKQYNVLSGGFAQINPNSCTYLSGYDISDTILSEDLNSVNLPEGTTTNERILQPNEVRWYVAGYVSSASPSITLTYNREEAWCRQVGTTGEIYQINEIKTLGGTYKVASADYSDYLGSVNCCPSAISGENVCSDDFKWEKIQGTECSLFNSCGSPNWVSNGDGELIKYSCEDGFCVEEIRKVECASDFDCRDSNEVCDLNKYECVDSNVNLDGDEITTIADSQTECLKDGGKWITKETTDSNFATFLGFKESDIIITEYCKMPRKINWVAWIIGLLAGGLLIGFFPRILGFFKMILSKFGIRF